MTVEGSLAQPPGFFGDRGVLVLDGGRVAAYDLQNGAALWSVARPATAAPVVTSDRVLILNDRTLTALDMRDGRPLWEIQAPSALAAPVTAVGGWLVTVDDADQLTAYRSADGGRIWSISVGGPSVQPASIEGERVYVARQDGTILALRLENGSAVWSRRIGGAPQPVLALSDRVYVGSDDNFLYCLTATDGRIAWRWRTGGDMIGRPTFDDDRLYVVSLDTVVRALDRRNGAQRWKYALSLRPTRGVVAAPGAVLVSGVNQVVQGIGTRDGAAVGTIDAGGLLAAAPHVVASPTLPSSLVVLVARSLERGNVMTAVTRTLEPPATPIQPLPDPNATPPLGGRITVSPGGDGKGAAPATATPPRVFDPPPSPAPSRAPSTD